jgi:acyl dehydratase
MKSISKHLITLICAGAFVAMPLFAETENPSPTPTVTPNTEPSATPSATPHNEPSATPTPHQEPSASPTETEHPEPSASPGETEHPEPSASPEGGHHGEVSLRGFYEGTTPTGALALFYIEKNTHVQIHLFDSAAQSVGFAEGALTDGSFSLTLTTGQVVTGTANDSGIGVNLDGQQFQAQRVPTFGTDLAVAGSYLGVAHGPTGESQVMFMIDANNNIVMIQRTGTVRTGGYGTITAPVAPATNYTFTLDHVIGGGSTVTGTFSIVDGIFSGTFTTSAGTFTVNSFKSSLANHMANISTRGLVGPGQGQLIGGFIITGGPKMVLIRAIGPSLAAAGVSPVLANPSLKLYSGSTLLGQNDDWKTNSNVADITASKMAPNDDLESALLVRLEPGAYTTVVTGADAATALALVEVYEIE